MPEPYIGEIRMIAFSFAPVGWLFCQGQQLPISENETLFQLIGTTYGGDGQSTFNLPNLASRIPLHAGTGPDGVNYQLSEMSGTESVTLTTQQIPTHTHPFTANIANGTATNPQGNVFSASASSLQTMVVGTGSDPMNPNSVTPVGGSQPHENMQPFLVINFIISLFGVFPTQT
jgi:microcystin-dependent protein